MESGENDRKPLLGLQSWLSCSWGKVVENGGHGCRCAAISTVCGELFHLEDPLDPAVFHRPGRDFHSATADFGGSFVIGQPLGTVWKTGAGPRSASPKPALAAQWISAKEW